MTMLRSARTSLLLSAASIFVVAAPAVASETDGFSLSLNLADLNNAPHASGPEFVVNAPHGDPGTLNGGGQINPGDVVNSPHISINGDYTQQDAYDPNNITGIGQIIADSGGGFIGTCTGTLINPRTVIFAAHCVNTRAATAYGANTGGVGIGVGFETNTRANAAGEVDELVRWLLGGSGGTGQFTSNTTQHFYNMNQVFWHSGSRAANSCTTPTSCFLEADIATGVLDTPAAGVPTWALLFSPLDTPAAIDPATGTGYHVNIAGYGSYGVGAAGAATSGNYRRRAAENMLGALTSINTRNAFLFGTGTAQLQQLYFLDFDDPNRGTASANSRDFNGFRDNALDREGLTGPGDSGGPLILDREFNKPVVIGVLSGGSTFYSGQPGGSYGAQSFYQPLFLYWDWIVENNPYRYVTAKAGNYNWSDSQAWLTELDPNYQIIVNGQLVNGLPTHLGGTNSGSGADFGELCFQSPSTSPNPLQNECYDLARGQVNDGVPNTSPTTGGAAANTGNLAGAAFVSKSDDLLQIVDAPHTSYSATPAGTPTLANGLPGATGFTPNNVDGDRANGTIGRYYDVTLRNIGVVTLNTAATVDRFSIMGAGAQLTIGAQGSLTSLMEIRQNTGTIVNNGILNSAGDYLVLSGLLTGNGRINAPFTTSVLGAFAPGTIGSTGTMTFNGGLVFSSGSSYLVDVGANGVSDRIAVVGANNQAILGGNVFVTYGANALANGNTYTILTAEGGLTGTFNQLAPISAILVPKLSYTANSVVLQITANKYTDVVAPSSAIGQTWARLLDGNRPNSAGYGTLYSVLDNADAATINTTLASWTPATETAALSLGIVIANSNNSFLSARLNTLDTSDRGGTLAHYGRPVEVAALNLSHMGGSSIRNDSSTPIIQENVLPDTVSGFIAGGYLNGDSASMIGTGTRDNYDGWYMGGGLEFGLGDTGLLGVAMTYTDTKATTSFAAQKVTGVAFQGSVYGKAGLTGRAQLDGQFNIGSLVTKTQRSASLGGTNYTLRTDDNALIVNTEVGVSFNLGNDNVEIAPRVAGRGTWIKFDDVQEIGGPMALNFNRDTYESIQGRLGLTVAGKGKGIRPFVSGTLVHEFNDRAANVLANLAGAAGPGVAFSLNTQDKNWAEIAGGIAITTGAVELSLAADSTLSRSDISAQTYRGAIKFRF